MMRIIARLCAALLDVSCVVCGRVQDVVGGLARYGASNTSALIVIGQVALYTMGFCNVQLNAQLLSKYEGSIEAVVIELAS